MSFEFFWKNVHEDHGGKYLTRNNNGSLENEQWKYSYVWTGRIHSDWKPLQSVLIRVDWLKTESDLSSALLAGAAWGLDWVTAKAVCEVVRAKQTNKQIYMCIYINILAGGIFHIPEWWGSLALGRSPIKRAGVTWSPAPSCFAAGESDDGCSAGRSKWALMSLHPKRCGDRNTGGEATLLVEPLSSKSVKQSSWQLSSSIPEAELLCWIQPCRWCMVTALLGLLLTPEKVLGPWKTTSPKTSLLFWLWRGWGPCKK